jgi:hypothetical protein
MGACADNEAISGINVECPLNRGANIDALTVEAYGSDCATLYGSTTIESDTWDSRLPKEVKRIVVLRSLALTVGT